MAHDPYHSGPVRTSRELSARVEQDFHTRGDAFRRRLGRWSLVASLVVVAGIGVTMATGQRSIYQAGPVAPAHQLVQNDCAVCHTTWAPAARLISFRGRRVTSVDDAACQKCHAGAAHFVGQDPPHGDLTCASCHREHRGDPSLVTAANDRCIACHQDLEPLLAAISKQGESSQERPETSIESFENQHPEFDALAKRDGTRLAFNHAVHLQHQYNAAGELVKGLLNEKGALEDLSKNCAACHQPGADKRYMLPIRYEQHCQRCHPLHFDNENFPGAVVPHGVSTELLRGFLVERYTQRAREGELHQEAPTPRRLLPGERAQETRLSSEARRDVDESASRADERLIAPIASPEDAADRAANRQGQMLVGPEAVGACRLCHTLSEDPTAATGGRSFRAAWRVDPPEIPDRWMARSYFSHDSHRLAACTKCHLDFSYNPPRPVVESQVTSDVLMPSIGLCRECHAQRVMATINLPGSDSGAGVASRCIDCHDYHQRSAENMDGSAVRSTSGPEKSGD
jgi:hypothetical protein